MKETRNNLFPVFLKAHTLEVLIVGGGHVGYEKLFFLLKSSPETPVRLVGQEIHADILALAAQHDGVTLFERPFLPADLIDVDLVIAATDDRETNLLIRAEAKRLKLLVNVADTPDLCDFYLGSIVTKGALKVAISTNGQSPTFAKRFREVLEESLPDSIPAMLQNLRLIRDQLKGDFGSKVKKLNEITSVLTKHA